jgi:hypothetical protein
MIKFYNINSLRPPRILNKRTTLQKFSFCKKEVNNGNNIKTGMMGKIKQYGKVGIIFYSAYSICGLLAFYFLLEYKYIKTDKVIEKFNEWGLNKYIDVQKKIEGANPKHVNLITAYLINQVFEIVRLPTTIIILKYIFSKRR